MKRFLLFIVAVMAVAMGYAQNNAPLCFAARNDSVTVRFDIKNVTHTIQYSTDGTSWSNYTPNSNVAIAADQSVYFRAATNQTTAKAFGHNAGSLCSRFYFSSANGGNVEGSGNIMSLYGPDCPDLPLPFVAFNRLFYQCTLLTKAPALPATTLQSYCYMEMFENCTALTVPPSLPATTLKDGCYGKMFKGCTSMVIDIVGPGVPWIIPDTIASAISPLNDMFSGTSGTMNGTPSVNTTYYIASARFDVTAEANDTTMGTVTGGGNYQCGDSATLTATPNAHYHFAGWSDGDTTNPRIVEVVSDTAFSAMFELDIYHVTAAPNKAERGTVTGGGDYAYNTVAALTATANKGYVFDGWDNGETNPTINITVVSDTVVTAIFSQQTGVEDANETDYVVFAEEGKIVVNGASSVIIYDAVGRVVYNGTTESDTARFVVSVAGVYFVRCDDAKSFRVVVR